MSSTRSPAARPMDGHDLDARKAMSFGSVVHINEKGGTFGGTEEYIALLTPALKRRGVRSHLVCGSTAGSLPPGLESVQVVDGLASRRSPPSTAAGLVSAVTRLDPDVVYVHNVFDPGIVPALAAIKGRGTLLWYIHDHYLTCLSELRWRRDLGSCPHRLGDGCLTAIDAGRCVLRHRDATYGVAELRHRQSLSRSMGSADGVVVVSDYMWTVVNEANPQLDHRLHRLLRPVRELGPVRPRHRVRSDDPAVVTYAGRITAEKGLAVVIEALAAIGHPGPVELRIAGVIEDPVYWSQCLQLGALATATNPALTITHVGHLDYDATDDLLRRSDIVAIPSLWPEPLGAVALEAMAAGAAVVAAAIGGLAETIVHEHNGLCARPGDHDSWVDALGALLQHPEHARRLAHQAQLDVAHVDIDDHLDDLDEIVTTHLASGASDRSRTHQH